LDIELPGQSKAAPQAVNAQTLGAHYPQLSSVAQAALDTLAAELSKQHSKSENTRLDISSVRRLYPLTEQAGQLIAARLDPRIKRQPAVFEAVAELADQRLLASETRLGSQALLIIAGFADESLDEGLLQDVEKAVAVRLERRKIQTDDSFWVHLIVYGRYEPFPKNDYGYLYDLCVIFHRNLSGRDGRVGHDNGYENTKFYIALEANKAASAHARVTQLLLNAEWAKKLGNELTDFRTGLKMHLSAFIYLKFRGEFEAEDYKFSRKLLDLIRLTADHYPAETMVALQLLGGFLTFNKISGAYYEVMQIPLFQAQGQKYTPVTKAKSVPHRDSTSHDAPAIAPVIPNVIQKIAPEEHAPEFVWDVKAEQDARQREQALQQSDTPFNEHRPADVEEQKQETPDTSLEATAPEAPVVKQKRPYQKRGANSAVKPTEKPAGVKRPSSSSIRAGLLDSLPNQLTAFSEEQRAEIPVPDSSPEL